MTMLIDEHRIGVPAEKQRSDATFLLTRARLKREQAKKCRALISELKHEGAIRMLTDLATELEQRAYQLESLARTEAAP
jgi:hypothetical protein